MSRASSCSNRRRVRDITPNQVQILTVLVLSTGFSARVEHWRKFVTFRLRRKWPGFWDEPHRFDISLSGLSVVTVLFQRKDMEHLLLQVRFWDIGKRLLPGGPRNAFFFFFPADVSVLRHGTDSTGPGPFGEIYQVPRVRGKKGLFPLNGAPLPSSIGTSFA